MRKTKVNANPPVKSYFDWDAITPVCKGCGQRSGRLDDASLCPPCRGQLTPPSPDESPRQRVTRPRRATVAEKWGTGRWVTRQGRGVWQPTIGPELPRSKGGGGSRPGAHGKPVDEEAVCTAYRAGTTAADLAREHDIGYKRIRAILTRHGLPLRDDRATRSGGANAILDDPDVITRVRTLYVDEHRSQAEVAKAAGVSVSTVNRLMARHGITARKSQCGRGDTLGGHRERLAALGITDREAKAWGVERGLCEPGQPGLASSALLDAWEVAHR